MTPARKRMRLEEGRRELLEPSATMNDLPSEVMKNIFSYVGKGNYCFVAPVSKDFCYNYLTMDVIEDKFAHKMDLFLAMKKGKKTSAEAVSSSFELAEYCFLYAPEDFQENVVRKAAMKGKHDIVEMGEAMGIDLMSIINGWDVNLIARRGKLKMLQLLHAKGLLEGKNIDVIIEQASSHGQLQVLKWLHKNEIFSDYCRKVMFITATQHGHMAILKWGAKVIRGKFATFGDQQFARSIMGFAARDSSIEFVKWCRSKDIPWNEDTFGFATKGGNIELLQYLFENDCPHDDPQICADAAQLDNHDKALEVLQLLHEQGVPWNESTCAAAARKGNLKALKFLRSNGCLWNQEALILAIRSRDYDVVEYCLQSNCPIGTRDVCHFAMEDNDHNRALRILKLLRQFTVPWSEITCSESARAGNLNGLKWLLSQGCLWNLKRCARHAAEYGNIEMMIWLKSKGCNFDEETFAAAAGKGHLEVLQWLRSENCSWDKEACLNAIRNGHMDVIRFCIDQEFPFDEEIYACIMEEVEDPIPILRALTKSGYVGQKIACTRAADYEDLKLLRWLRFNGYQWDESVCNEAVINKDLSMLKYAHENGCPWTKETYAYCLSWEGLDHVYREIPTEADSRSEDILTYLKEQGCPRPQPSDWRVY
ncbi:hypothetical protein CTEN210_09810 [Chaetoceros tenuissimus]|uniref:F-box domain-containing protein n=1 Tax=Chaetoceros tenuissimus TaxID=426638 RepID=A0AAD3CWU4_9STRA|nr:hypothetical protein CTEN210_09810 [Chaetoceros tenuissimus]